VYPPTDHVHVQVKENEKAYAYIYVGQLDTFHSTQKCY